MLEDIVKRTKVPTVEAQIGVFKEKSIHQVS